MPQDPLSELLSLPVMSAKLQSTKAPELSELQKRRLQEAANRVRMQGYRLPYMTYDDISKGEEDDIYDPSDFKTVGQKIRDNVVKAVEARFPIVGDNYTLKVENVHYEKPKQTAIKEEREVLLNERSLNDRLRGDWVLYDNATGKEVQRKSATLLNVPRMTERGTFIRNGSELGLKHMFRLRPGVYTNIKRNGIVASHINPAQTTGRQMTIEMEPTTGVMSVKRGTRSYGLLPIMRAAGVSDDAIKAVWGEDIFNINEKKYGKLSVPNTDSSKEYSNLWEEGFVPILLDSETTESTLGKPFAKMEPEVLLRASGNILKVSKSMDEKDTDDRDSLLYQRIMGPADYIPERIVRDGGGLLRKLFRQVTRTGNLDSVATGAFQPHVDSVFLEDKHAGYIDGSSPAEGLDFAVSVSRLGEGGIGSVDAAPVETRGVNDSYLGFIDPIRCYDELTEYLTKDGWKLWKDVTPEDELACMLDGAVEYHPYISRHEYNYAGSMYSYEDRNISFRVNEHHRLAIPVVNGKARAYRFDSVGSVFRDRLKASSANSEALGKGLPFMSSLDHLNLLCDMGLSVQELVHIDTGNIEMELIETSCKVYCFTVPGGMLYVRRNGKHGFWCGNSPECHTTDTQYLTETGWKYYKDITEEDKLACNVKGNIEYHPYTDRHQSKYKGCLYTYDDGVVAFSVTHNHRMMFVHTMDKNNRAYSTLTAEELVWLRDRSRKDLRVPVDVSVEDTYKSHRLFLADIKVEQAKDITVCCFTVPGGMLYTRRGVDRQGFWSGNSLKVGLDVYFTHGVRKGSSGKLYNTFKDRTGTPRLVDMGTTAKSIVATPEFYNPQGDPNEFIPAIYKGKGIEYVQRKDVDFYVDDSNNMMSMGAGMIPLIGGIRSNRTLMGSKYANQALSLPNREAPLVQRRLKLADGTYTTSERELGRKMGAKFSPVRGTVLSVDKDSIVIRDREGKKHEIGLYNDFAANQKGFLSSTPVVKPGDRVTEGQIIAPSNYTDKDGTAALGVNLRVAFMTGPNAGTFEDSTMVSESCAKKMASEQMCKTRGDTTSDIEYSKSRYLSLFKNEYTKEQLDKLDDNGLPKPGTVFNTGDPVYLGIRHNSIDVHGVARQAAAPYVATWEHNAPGTVTDVVHGKNHMTVYTKAISPLEVGDKMCFDEETQVLTDRGWKFFKDLDETERVLTLDIRSGETWFTVYSSWFTYPYKGKMYSLTTPKLDICVTPDHSLPVSALPDPAYMLFQKASEVFGKPRYFITGHDISTCKSFAYSKDKDRKEKWINYDGQVYCICVPSTHIMYVRRNGKAMWSGNSARYGNKGINVRIVPDSDMIRDENGVPFDIYQSPLGLPSRLNTSLLSELQLGKIASKTGKVYELPDFLPDDDNIIDFTARELKKHGMSATETVYDPTTGKSIPGIETGVMFYYKLKHMAELKERGRSTGGYSSEEVPLKGEGAARRLGAMESSAVYAGGGEEVLRDAKIIRGQKNDEFWRSFRAGQFPEVPAIPLVHKKFFAHLRAAGIQLEDRAQTVHMYGATDSNIRDLTQQRKVETPTTFDSKTMSPIPGGLFDTRIFGAEGDKWGYIELPEPVLNPLMTKTVASILGWKDKEINEYLEGSRSLNGKFGTDNLISTLKDIDLKKELRDAKEVIKNPKTTLQQRDLARKRIRAIEPMLREGKTPDEFFLTRMPVLPPKFRAVAEMSSGVNIAADANFLYKRLLEATADMRQAMEALPEEYLLDARKSVQNAVKALVGVTETDDPKLASKGIGGVLKWAFGKGSPKLSSLHRKVFGSNLDLGGLGTIVADNSLTIDEVGIPEKSAWKMFEPFVVRKLTQGGYSMVEALRQVTSQSKEARRVLEQVMEERPILLNRAPTLWRYGIMGSKPKLVKGDAIRVNPNICKLYGADFDGDTIRNLCRIVVDLKNIREIFNNSTNDLLTNPEKRLYYVLDSENKEERSVSNMFKADTRIQGMLSCISLADLPHVAGTEIKKSDTVTEWDVPEGYSVDTIDPVTGNRVVAPITKVSKHTGLKMYDVATSVSGSYGNVITASEDHSLITLNPETMELENTKPVDSVGRCVPRKKFCIQNQWDRCLQYIKLGTQCRLTYDMGVFIGTMLGDGWVDANYTVRVACCDKSLQDYYMKMFTVENSPIPVRKNSEMFSYEADERRFSSADAQRFTIYVSREAAIELKAKIGTGAENKRIPVECLNASHAHMAGVLMGLLATDGSVTYSTGSTSRKAAHKVVAIHTVSTYLRDGIQQLANRLGIRTSATPYMGVNSTMTCYAVTFSLEDLAAVYIGNKSLFQIPMESKRIALEKIVAEVSALRKGVSTYTKVPFPKAILCEAYYAGLNKGEFRNLMMTARKTGYISLLHAKQMIDILKDADWDNYKQSNCVAKEDRTNHTPEQARYFINKWIEIVKDETVDWASVDSVIESTCTDGWDITVPGPFTFPLYDGTIVQDSMTTHVPVSNEAVRAIKENMLPSKQLLSPRNYRAHFIPRSEFTQGLYLASRNNPNAGAPVRFNSEEDMLQAYQRGEIRVDTPVEIVGK